MQPKARFWLLDPAPREGVTFFCVLDDELGAVIAFAPAKQLGQRIVEALNKHFTVKP